MAINKKKTRPITIDNEKFRWLASPREKGIIAMVAEKADSNGSLLDVRFQSDINDWWVEFPNVDHLNTKILKPKDVEIIIRQALILGWNPNESGKPVKFYFDGKTLVNSW